MKRVIFSIAAIAAIAVLGTALFFFTPVFGFTQIKSTPRRRLDRCPRLRSSRPSTRLLSRSRHLSAR